MQKDRVFNHGRRCPTGTRPSNGLGLSTPPIQDGLQPGLEASPPSSAARPALPLLGTYSQERAPVARRDRHPRQLQSIAEFGPIFEALGMDGGTDIGKIQASMDARCDATDAAEKQREALRKAFEFKKYEFDAHGVEMNQRYASAATVTDGPARAVSFPPRTRELHYSADHMARARGLPHAWVYDQEGKRHSTLDLTGKGVSRS